MVQRPYKKLPKYGAGAFIKENASGIGGAASFLADASSVLANPKKANVGLNTAQGALKGAAAGAALGPIGMGVGALVGGVTSFIGARAQKKKMEEEARQEMENTKNLALNNSKQILSNYNTLGNTGASYYKKGGLVKKYQNGGINTDDPTKPKTDKEDKVIYTSKKGNLIKEKEWNIQKKNWNSLQDYTDYIDRWALPEKGQSGKPIMAYERVLNGRTSYYKKEGSTDLGEIPQQDFIAYRNRQRNSGLKDASLPYIPQMKKGGKTFTPQYEVEKGEVVQGKDTILEDGKNIASDLKLVEGETHEQGGTKGAGGERVYSDHLKINSTLKDTLNKLGLNINKSTTYADVSKQVGIKKGNLEKKLGLNLNNKLGNNSSNEMLKRYDSILDFIFKAQEDSKPYKEKRDNMQMRYGGVPKYEDGILLSSGNKNYNFKQSLDDILNKGKQKPLDINTPLNKNLSDTPFSRSVLGKKTALSKDRVQLDMKPIPKTSALSPNNFSARNMKSQMGTKEGNGFMNGLKENSGQLANFGSYLANLASINKLDTSVKRNLLANPSYNYQDRSGLGKYENQKSLNSVLSSLSTTSGGVNMSNTGAAYAGYLDANNKLQDAENKRKDEYDDNFNQRADRVGQVNTMITNEANDMKRDMKNQKDVQMPLQARNSFTQGIIGNDVMKRAENLDLKKAAIQAYGNDSNGNMSRFFDDEHQGNLKKFMSQFKDMKYKKGGKIKKNC